MKTELLELRAEILFQPSPALSSRELSSIRAKWVRAYQYTKRKENAAMHVNRLPRWLVNHIAHYFGLPQALAEIQVHEAADEICEAETHAEIVGVARELGLNINSQEGDKFLIWANATRQMKGLSCQVT